MSFGFLLSTPTTLDNATQTRSNVQQFGNQSEISRSDIQQYHVSNNTNTYSTNHALLSHITKGQYTPYPPNISQYNGINHEPRCRGRPPKYTKSHIDVVPFNLPPIADN